VLQRSVKGLEVHKLWHELWHRIVNLRQSSQQSEYFKTWNASFYWARRDTSSIPVTLGLWEDLGKIMFLQCDHQVQNHSTPGFAINSLSSAVILEVDLWMAGTKYNGGWLEWRWTRSFCGEACEYCKQHSLAQLIVDASYTLECLPRLIIQAYLYPIAGLLRPK